MLAQELHKTLIKKFKRKKNYVRFSDNTWAADLAEMRPLSSSNRGMKYLLREIDVFTKYAWGKPLNDKKSKIVLNGFIGIVNESKRKPNKLSGNQGREFYNKLMQERLDNNDVLMYSRYNEGKSVVAERFIGNLERKISEKNDS